MKILFFLAVWRRPEITEICFMGLNRLKNAGLFPVEFLAVISEESMKPLCKKYGIDYVMHENLPLGKKKNFGLTEAMKRDWDYIIELGSDDVLKTELLEVYRPHFELNHSVMTFNTLCFLNSVDLECRLVKTATSYGMGRAIERSVLERLTKGVEIEPKEQLISPGRSCGPGEIGFFPKRDAYLMENAGQAKVLSYEKYKLWGDNLNKGLDNSSNFFFHTRGVVSHNVQVSEPLGMDIKSSENIWGFNKESGHPYDLNLFMNGLSDGEKEAIINLKEMVCA